MRSLWGVIALAGVVSMSAANAETIWQCSYRSEDGQSPSIPAKFVEDEKSRILSGYVDDLTGRPHRYQIVQNSEIGLIAISPHSDPAENGSTPDMGVAVVLLNKRTGDLQVKGLQLRIAGEDNYRGHCKRRN
jgi:hypothetical protein